jgi:spoIIIJ-associated protein
MDQPYIEAKDFLITLFRGIDLDLKISIKESSNGYDLDLNGEDASLLQAEGGELLNAIEHLVNQIYAHKLGDDKRYLCDVNGFRAIRETELRAMAKLVGDQVKSTGVSFTFAPMNANERRIIHLVLASDETLHTESIGEGNNRRIKVSLNPAK